jgi:molybdopterin synthase sulfur carrier subunit
LKLVYFAWLRERLSMSEEIVDLPEGTHTVSDLLGWLASRNEAFAGVFEHSDIIQIAIDQEHTLDRSASIVDAREIALFPPMTGG